jgi:hypothetical protein
MNDKYEEFYKERAEKKAILKRFARLLEIAKDVLEDHIEMQEVDTEAFERLAAFLKEQDK